MLPTGERGELRATVGAVTAERRRGKTGLSRDRTATITANVQTGSINLPSNAELARRIGTIRVPIDYYVRTDPRINGGG